MEQIRAWVLAVCFACIAAGILGQLSSSRTRFSVIKLILTLYILIPHSPRCKAWAMGM